MYRAGRSGERSRRGPHDETTRSPSFSRLLAPTTHRGPQRGGMPPAATPDDVLRIAKGRQSDRLGVRFYDEDGFDDHDLWSRDGATTRAGAPCAVVEAVDLDGAAARAGMEAEDIIVTLNGHAGISREQVLSLLRSFVGTLDIGVRRADGRPRGNAAAVTAVAKLPIARHKELSRGGGGGGRSSARAGIAAKPTVSAPTAATDASGPPVTPRLMKSSIQLHKELKEVGETIQNISDRVEQALVITRGTRNQLATCAESTRKSMETNPSLTGGGAARPQAPTVAATRATERAAATHDADQKLRSRLGREPTQEELDVEVEAELHLQRRDRRRQKEVNTPIVEALTELEETSSNGLELLDGHAEKLEHVLRQLHEVYGVLGTHFWQRDAVVNATNRSAVPRLDDEPTHEALRLAAEREDTARHVSNQAIKAARLEASTMQMNKAAVQRAARRRLDMVAQHYRNDRAGTSFHGWTNEVCGCARHTHTRPSLGRQNGEIPNSPAPSCLPAPLTHLSQHARTRQEVKLGAEADAR